MENGIGLTQMQQEIVDKVGIDGLADVASHGADGGVSGFIYCSETVAFWKKYRPEIMDMLEALADDLREEPACIVGAFMCLKYYDYETRTWTDKEGRDAVYKTLYGGRKDTDDYVANALAWFALEEVAVKIIEG